MKIKPLIWTPHSYKKLIPQISEYRTISKWNAVVGGRPICTISKSREGYMIIWRPAIEASNYPSWYSWQDSIKKYLTLEEAKSAAQSHWENMIMECVEM
jgi:hypothetical protein